MRISDWSSDVCSSDLAAARSPIDALLASRERPGEALRLADTILSRDATHCPALTVRADILLRHGRPAGALRSAQRAPSQCPARSAAWMIAAEASVRRHAPEKSLHMRHPGIVGNSTEPHHIGRL